MHIILLLFIVHVYKKPHIFKQKQWTAFTQWTGYLSCLSAACEAFIALVMWDCKPRFHFYKIPAEMKNKNNSEVHKNSRKDLWHLICVDSR